MQKNIILILGSKGMLGQELTHIFQKDNKYIVIGWDKETIDITAKKETTEKVLSLKPKIIINATGYNAVDKCENNKKEFELAKKINSEAPGYLAKLAKKLQSIFVNYSSDYVFDGKPIIPEPSECSHSCTTCLLHQEFKSQIGFDEYAQTNPISNYGKSKLMGEKEVVKNGKKYYIIRTSKIFGNPAQSKLAKKSFFDIMLEAGKKNKEVMVVNEETSCFTYAPDLAKKTKEIIESKKPFGIYHITNGDPCTWYEGVLELYRLVKLKTKVKPISSDKFPRPAKRPSYSVLLSTKLNPLRSYKNALKEYLKNGQ